MNPQLTVAEEALGLAQFGKHRQNDDRSEWPHHAADIERQPLRALGSQRVVHSSTVRP